MVVTYLFIQWEHFTKKIAFFILGIFQIHAALKSALHDWKIALSTAQAPPNRNSKFGGFLDYHQRKSGSALTILLTHHSGVSQIATTLY